jgi:hypothetical protein
VGGEDAYSVGSLKKSQPQSLDNPYQYIVFMHPAALIYSSQTMPFPPTMQLKHHTGRGIHDNYINISRVTHTKTAMLLRI